MTKRKIHTGKIYKITLFPTRKNFIEILAMPFKQSKSQAHLYTEILTDQLGQFTKQNPLSISPHKALLEEMLTRLC